MAPAGPLLCRARRRCRQGRRVVMPNGRFVRSVEPFGPGALPRSRPERNRPVPGGRARERPRRAVGPAAARASGRRAGRLERLPGAGPGLFAPAGWRALPGPRHPPRRHAGRGRAGPVRGRGSGRLAARTSVGRAVGRPPGGGVDRPAGHAGQPRPHSGPRVPASPDKPSTRAPAWRSTGWVAGTASCGGSTRCWGETAGRLTQQD